MQKRTSLPLSSRIWCACVPCFVCALRPIELRLACLSGAQGLAYARFVQGQGMVSPGVKLAPLPGLEDGASMKYVVSACHALFYLAITRMVVRSGNGRSWRP